MKLAEQRLQELTLGSLSSIEVSFFSGPSRAADYYDLLVVKFSGRYRNGSSGNPDALFMSAMAEAGIVAWGPAGLILDLRELEYEWGDLLEAVFAAGESHYGDTRFPQAIIVGPPCEKAVRTLVLGLDSTEPLESVPWVFRELESAWAYVEAQLST